ncbi:hypothetical protein ACNEP9_06695 [Escherichia coli]
MKKIIGTSEFSQLEPWFYLDENRCFFANKKWPNVIGEQLFAFAKRQDNDELACFKINESGVCEGVYLINGWTLTGLILYNFTLIFGNGYIWLYKMSRSGLIIKDNLKQK